MIRAVRVVLGRPTVPFINLHSQRCFNVSRTAVFNQIRDPSTDGQEQRKDVVPDTQSGRTGLTVNTKVPLVKKDNREPFVKGFFMGKIDIELVAFPEILNGEQLKVLEEEVKPIREYFDKKTSSTDIDTKVMQQLKNLRMFGLNIPQHLHGSGYFETETEYASDSVGNDYNIGSLLTRHRLVVDLINEFGTDEQKIRFLSKMATGDWPATIAIFEDNQSSTSSSSGGSGSFQTTGAMNVDEKSWKVKGTKTHVVNASNAKWFLVGVQLEYINYAGELKEGLALFLVNKDSHGVTVEREVQPNKFTVTFNNVIVGAENMLGSYENMTQIGMRLLSRSRLYDGHMATGLMKNVLRHNAKVNVSKKLGPALISEKPVYQERSGKMCSEIFAIESAMYFITGLLDGYKSPDIELECALLKSYASKQVLKGVQENLNFSGQSFMDPGTDTQRILAGAIDLQTHSESLDALRLYIGLMGLQYAGMQIHETVKKGRNPMHNPMSVIGKIFRGQKMDEPKPVVHLQHYFHPSFDTAAKMIEKSIIRQQLATEILLTVFGKLIADHDSLVLRVAELCELNFMMLCTMMRASRSYCIGLPYCEYDMFIANSFIHDKFFEAESIAFKLANSDLPLIDTNWARAGRKMFELQKYYQEHPLSRNF